MLQVLIVEDYAPLRALYSRFLAYTGKDAIHVYTYYEALQRLEASVPDAVVVDLSTQDGNGWQLVRILWRDRRFQDVPIVALLDAGSEPINWRDGITQCLSKPVPLPKLLALLERLAAEQQGPVPVYSA